MLKYSNWNVETVVSKSSLPSDLLLWNTTLSTSLEKLVSSTLFNYLILAHFLKNLMGIEQWKIIITAASSCAQLFSHWFIDRSYAILFYAFVIQSYRSVIHKYIAVTFIVFHRFSCAIFRFFPLFCQVLTMISNFSLFNAISCTVPWDSYIYLQLARC